MSFRFKQFAIDDSRCAMKVGTDGVLLGAWARIGDGARRVLDVGTGSGLVAVMLAQRYAEVMVTGIDIDGDAVFQAAANMECSPWAERLRAVQCDFLQWHDEVDAIVCNPPYFTRSLRCPDAARSLARHDDSLPLPLLAAHAAEVLREGGVLCVVLPADVAFAPAGMALRRRCMVCGTEKKPPKRQLLEFVMGEGGHLTEERLVLTTPDGGRTASHQALTEMFYL